MANGYMAGDLNLSIQSSADNTLKYLDAVIGRLDFIEKGLGGIKRNSYIRKTSSRNNTSSRGIFGFAKMGVNLYMMRRMGRFMANLVQAGSDYNETLNLWQVAMRNNLDVADQFVNKMQKAYGISTKTLMNAQAVFKNMVGSLGQISDATAYALSEALVQMSADYASLYNRTLESAFQNMQSMLAGQVRPIRSAGLDITETTLYQFYQQLGGTKSMRQLNRTEKQLLSILAVYKQMGSAGALGDMTKTLNQFANQSRMMAEYWAELKTWSGLLLKDWIDQNEILVKINAGLIVMTEIVKAIAKSRGIGEENFVNGIFETTQATNDEIDELQGKLLDFDKFRSLESASTGELAIDEKLIEAITGYSSNIDQATNKAQQLADAWLLALGFEKDINGELVLTEKNLNDIETILSNIGIIIGTIASIGIGKSLVSLYSTIIPPLVLGLMEILTTTKGLTSNVTLLGKAFSLFLNHPIFSIIIGIVGAITALYFINEDVRNSVNRLFDSLSPLFNVLGNLFNQILKPLGKILGSTIDLLSNIIVIVVNSLVPIINSATLALTPFVYVIEAVFKVLSSIFELLNSLLSFNFSNLGQKLGNIWTNWDSKDFASSAWSNLSSSWNRVDTPPIDADVLSANYIGNVSTVYTPTNYSNRNSNIQQMEQAFYNALTRHTAEGNDKIIVQAYLDGEKVYENTTAKAKAKGKVWAKA